jgi:hypothetical protein
MIVAQNLDQQTGVFSRIENPRQIIAEDALDARIRAAVNPHEPIRNVFAGAAGTGLFSRIAAWFRGDR